MTKSEDPITPPSTATGSGQSNISTILVILSLPRFIPRASSVPAVQWSLGNVFGYANKQVREEFVVAFAQHVDATRYLRRALGY